MSILVVVAEPEEISLIPRAYQGLPILITGVGAKALDALQNLDPSVNTLVNVGYCGAKDFPIGTVVENAHCLSVNNFLEGLFDQEIKEEDLNDKVVDMEYKWIQRWCDARDVTLIAIKVVSDNLSYQQYKEKSLEKKNEAQE